MLLLLLMLMLWSSLLLRITLDFSFLTRQITEAVRIRNRGKSVLNSKGEYDRCRIHRLTIGTDERPNGGITVTETEGTTMEDIVGEQYLLGKRKEMDRGKMKGKADMGSTSKKWGNNCYRDRGNHNGGYCGGTILMGEEERDG